MPLDRISFIDPVRATFGKKMKITMSEEDYLKQKMQRELSLFTHYSTVRMTVLAFLIPLGGLMIINGKISAGLWVIIVAYGINLLFGIEMALRRWLIHMNIDLWLRYKTEETYGTVKQGFPGFKWLVTGNLDAYTIQEVSFSQGSGENATTKSWKNIWSGTLNRARKTELRLQICVLVGVAVFLSLLFSCLP